MELCCRQVNGLSLQVSPRLSGLGVPHAFTTRAGGVSGGIYAALNLGMNRGDEAENVRENYRRVCGALGVAEDKLVFSCQVHRDTVRVVTAADAGKGLDREIDYQADGLVSNVPGLTLVVFGADCLTALLYDPVRGAMGAVHAGWRGTALGILERAVETMREAYGSRPEELRVALGPCIGPCCFETDGDVPQAMTRALGEAAQPFLHWGEGERCRVDLKGLNGLWLKRAGVLEENMDVSSECTMCLPEKYWSHRYTKGERGSQAALISLPRGSRGA